MMRKIDIENWVLGIIERVEKKQPLEDDRVELKMMWPVNFYKTARQIAAHANAARFEPIIWIIGINERGYEITGCENIEMSNWYSKIRSKYDGGIAPELVTLNVPVGEKTVTALYFETDRAPYVIKNPEGGRITFEVPWREANYTRSAKRSDLIKMLTPLQAIPKVEVLSGELQFTRQIGMDRKAYQWDLKLDLYITASQREFLIIPLHKCFIELELDGNDDRVELDTMQFQLPKRRKIGVGSDTSTAANTKTEVIIDTAGSVTLRGSLRVDKNLNQDYKEIIVKTFLTPIHAAHRVKVITKMQKTDSTDSYEWIFKEYFS